MRLSRSLRTALLAACGLVGSAAVSAQAPPANLDANPFSDQQTLAIERLIRDYIVKHPEVLLEAQAVLETQAETRRVDVIRKVLADNKQAIYHDPQLPFIGNPKGDVIVVEFFDYNCPYCRRAATEIAKLVASDPNVKVVFQEFPNLGPDSDAVSHIAVAASRQGKYYTLHRALLDIKGPTSEARALDIAGKIGIDVPRLKKDAALPEVKNIVAKGRAIAAKLSLEGTPMFLIGDRYIQGMPENFYDELTRNVAAVRKDGCKVC